MAKILDRYGRFAAKNPWIVITAGLILTVFMAANALQLEIDTNFDNSLPQYLESIQNDQLLKAEFEEPETFLILVKLDDTRSLENGIKDIRDPGLMVRLLELEELLRSRAEIKSISGPPDVLLQAFGFIPKDPDMVNAVLDFPIVSKDYAFTMLVADVNIATDDDKILSFVDSLEDDIDSIGFPGSVDILVTGGSLVETTIFTLLLEDMTTTMGVAALFILIVLILAYRSPVKGFFAILLLVFAIIWTGGTMQLIGIPLTIITVMIGAMVIGIGIDYTIHIMNRYEEERKKGAAKPKAAGISVSKVGLAIIGTSVTTIASFLSLAGANVPFMTQMGIALSLGIFYAMIASMFLLPAMVVIEERISFACKRRLFDD